jgi:hypothetical protein
MPMRQLSSAWTMSRKNFDRAALFSAAYRKVLPLFLKQMEHWMRFQQYWQWFNRGNAAGQGIHCFPRIDEDRLLRQGVDGGRCG